MTDVESTMKLYAPTFKGGGEEEFRIFKVKMQSYIAGVAKCSELFGAQGANVLTDANDLTALADDDARQAAETLRSKNRKAAGILLSAIETSTEGGKAAFELIKEYYTESSGFPGGHFKNAWTALTEWYEEVEAPNIAKLKTDYYSKKMSKSENPQLFIVDLNGLRDRMTKAGYTLTDAAYIEDILEKLPSGTKDAAGPYDIEIGMAKLHIADATRARPYDLKDLTKDLSNAYKRLKDNGMIEETSNETALYTSGKPFKGQCRQCGKRGHTARDCHERKGNGKKGFQKKKGGWKAQDMSKDQTKKKFQGKCHYCGKKGHMKYECRKRLAEEGENANVAKTNGHGEVALSGIEEGSNEEWDWTSVGPDPEYCQTCEEDTGKLLSDGKSE